MAQNPVVGILYADVMVAVAVVVGVDLLVFHDQPWMYLSVNTGIVLELAAFYLRFAGKS